MPRADDDDIFRVAIPLSDLSEGSEEDSACQESCISGGDDQAEEDPRPHQASVAGAVGTGSSTHCQAPTGGHDSSANSEMKKVQAISLRPGSLVIATQGLSRSVAGDARLNCHAWHAANARQRLRTTAQHAEHGEVGEQMILKAHNSFRLPRNQLKLNESRTQKGHDCTSRDGQPVEIKTGYGRQNDLNPQSCLPSGGGRSLNKSVQKNALENMEKATSRSDGIVITTKGNRAFEDERVKESRISDRDIEEARVALATSSSPSHFVIRHAGLAAGATLAASLGHNFPAFLKGRMTGTEFLAEALFDAIPVGIGFAVGAAVGIKFSNAGCPQVRSEMAVTATIASTETLSRLTVEYLRARYPAHQVKSKMVDAHLALKLKFS